MAEEKPTIQRRWLVPLLRLRLWIAELFEARSPKDKGVLAEITGTVSFGKETKGKIRLQITDPDGKVWEELVPKEKNILVHEGQVVNKGESVVDGPADPALRHPAAHALGEQGDQQRERVPATPQAADDQRAQQAAALRHDRRNRREMVGFGRVTEPENEAKRRQGIDGDGGHEGSTQCRALIGIARQWRRPV